MHHKIMNVLRESTLRVNNAKHESLQAIQDILTEHTLDSTQDFRKVLQEIVDLGDVAGERFANQVGVGEDVVYDWMNGKCSPKGSVRKAVLNEAVMLARANLTPCDPKYEYAGHVIVGEWVLPLGMNEETPFSEKLWKQYGYSDKAAQKGWEALSEQQINTVVQFLENPDKITQESGVGKVAVQYIMYFVRNIGVRKVGEKMLTSS